MKVAALVERRDRIMKNRRIAKCRKKSTTTPPQPPISEITPPAIEVEAESTETHELKIKTVFQRHKQEHHEQEEAAAIRTVRKRQEKIVLSLFSVKRCNCCVRVTALCRRMQCTVII